MEQRLSAQRKVQFFSPSRRLEEVPPLTENIGMSWNLRFVLTRPRENRTVWL